MTDRILVHGLLSPQVSAAEFQRGVGGLIHLAHRSAYRSVFEKLVADGRMDPPQLVLMAQQFPQAAVKNPQADALLSPEPVDPDNARRFVTNLWVGWCTEVRKWAYNTLVQPGEASWILAHVLTGVGVFATRREARATLLHESAFNTWVDGLDTEQKHSVHLGLAYLKQVASLEATPLDTMIPSIATWIGSRPAEERMILEASALLMVSEHAVAFVDKEPPPPPAIPRPTLVHTRLGKLLMRCRPEGGEDAYVAR